MQFFEKIEYIGNPPKAIMPNGLYCWTLIDCNVPVTNLHVGEFFGTYLFLNPSQKYGLPRIMLDINDTKDATFIGEGVIIYNLLDVMRVNSFDAGDYTFKIKAADYGERICVIISDDGKGISITRA